jgi:putative ABC transport system permease protein
MLKNYIKIAFRNFIKQKAFSLINIFGLTIGITAVILIALNIKNEYSFNSFHKNIDRIYRVNVSRERNGKITGESYVFVPPIGPAMLKDFPEVKNFVRFSTNRTMYLNYKDKSFKTENVTYADSSLFKVFTFNMLEGNPDKALASPYSIILTQNTASKIFGREDPSGKIISINNNTYKINGVIQNPPGNSDIQFNAIISFSTLYKDPDNWMGWNGGNQYITYVQLNKNASSEEIDKKFPDFLWLYLNKDLTKLGIKYKASLQPLKDIHLRYNEDSASLRNNTYLFSIITLFILFIACINFINLSTAKSSNRAKDSSRSIFIRINNNLYHLHSFSFNVGRTIITVV